jgi:hypothetical protein
LTPQGRPGVSDRAFALDLGCVFVISVGICLLSKQLDAMTFLVGAALGLRLWLYARIPRQGRDLSVGAELLFFALCTVLGAANDWNSVTRHRIYDYTVPVYFPEWSRVPIWMLLFWGMILRLVSSLFRWIRLQLTPPPNTVHLGGAPLRSTALRLAVLLLLVLITRQTIYRLYLDPVLSWVPFLLGIACMLLLLRPDVRRVIVLAVFGCVGPAVEVLYIQIGQLHAYHLGVLWGVPVWIALWWILSAAVWGEISARIVTWLARVPGSPPVPSSTGSRVPGVAGGVGLGHFDRDGRSGLGNTARRGPRPADCHTRRTR